MPSIDQPAITRGSIVLITGGARNHPQSVEERVGSLFDTKYGHGSFEFVTVPDMESGGAFDQVVKGVSAVIHTATNPSMDPNSHEVIPKTVAGTTNALKATASEPSVKRFVLTSSSTAALIPKPNTPCTVITETWNEEAVSSAYRDPPYEPERGYPIYAASKTLSEKAAWNFMRENNPGFALNAVIPDLTLGASLDLAHQRHASTSGFLAELFRGNTKPLARIPPQYFVDVRDVALLHVAAAIHPAVRSERIFVFAEPFNGDDALCILRRLYPDRSFPANFQSDKDLSDIVSRKRAEELLRDMERKGWTSLEDSIRKNTADLAWSTKTPGSPVIELGGDFV